MKEFLIRTIKETNLNTDSVVFLKRPTILMKSDYLSKNSIEENCNCAGVFMIRELPPTNLYGNSGVFAPNLNILLVESKRKNYQFSFPKGKRNKGEHTLDAAKRELYEETGLKEEDYEIYPDKRYIEYRSDTNKPHIVYYMAKLTNQSAQLCPIDTREIVSAKWLSPDEIYTMRRSLYFQRRQIVTRGIRHYIMRCVMKQSRKNAFSSSCNVTSCQIEQVPSASCA